MVHDAVTSRSVTGKVVAAGLLDELRRLQSATRADAGKRDLSNAWTGEIKLAVPETGVRSVRSHAPSSPDLGTTCTSKGSWCRPRRVG